MTNTNTQLTIASSIIAGGLIIAAVLFTGSDGENRPGTKTFDIVIQNNRYNPSEVVASVGDRVVINFENRDAIAHGVAIPEFNATVPGGHLQPGRTARMEFVASRKLDTDAAVCGGPRPEDKTDVHGEELKVRVI